jgi:glycosyltransferase involved in cell wall biosynthesis
MIPVFNAGHFLEEALRSVLQQDPGPEAMQVAVADDASTDVDVNDLVTRVAGGRVEYHQHPQNIGSVRNFNACLNLARGRYVHLLHADDRVLNGYYAAIEGLFARYPQAGACFSGLRYVDETVGMENVESSFAESDGILEDWLQTVATGARTQYPALAVRRSVYEVVGGYFGVSYGEDWEMQVRIASRYPVAYTPDVLAEYRVHRDSISGAKVRSGDNLTDIAWVIRTIQAYLPPEDRGRLRAEAEKKSAGYGIEVARQLWRFQRDRAAARGQLEAVLRLWNNEETRRAADEVYAEMSHWRPIHDALLGGWVRRAAGRLKLRVVHPAIRAAGSLVGRIPEPIRPKVRTRDRKGRRG